MGVLTMIAQMILALTILVTIHEFGHYITAKWFNVQVDKFFVFMDAPLGKGKKKEGETDEEYKKRGWDGKIWKTKRGETEFGFGWLPLGGYVKLAGMIDESMDKDWKDIPEDRQFRFKPAWQKLIIMLAGIFLNLVLGVLIFSGLNATNKQFLPLEKVADKLVVSDYAKKIGIQDGDIPIGANGKPLTRLTDLRKAVGFGGDLQVKRNSSTVIIPIPDSLFTSGEELFSHQFKKEVLLAPSKDGSGKKAGLKNGDQVLSVDGETMETIEQFMSVVSDNPGKELSFLVKRDDKELPKKVAVSDEGKIGTGFFTPELSEIYKPYYTKMSAGQAIQYGFKDAFDMIRLNIKAFGLIGKGKMKAKDSLAGPIQIATLFGSNWDWGRFWTLTGSLSMILAFVNVLPIPALDGGHAVFAIIEMLTGKPVNEKILEITQIIGFFIIMTLMVLILGNDILKVIGF